ncbi:uncharacterized protein [Eurosta solidaginis]|uniref:uncharacterized protein n=1 Tax=Eurosta solidaginis TaxID=178769 RepID=UPI0035308D30
MAAFKKIVNALRSNKTLSTCDTSTMSDNSLPSTYTSNTSAYSFCNNFDVSHRTSVMSTISDIPRTINYANELTKWQHMDVANTTMPGAVGSAMMPGGYYGQYRYDDSYMGAIPFQTPSYGYPFTLDSSTLLPTDNEMFSDNHLTCTENHLPPTAHLPSLSQTKSQFPNISTDTCRSNMTAISLDKLKRMRAAKDLYNVLNYLDNDDSRLKKANKSSGRKSNGYNEKLF